VTGTARERSEQGALACSHPASRRARLASPTKKGGLVQEAKPDRWVARSARRRRVIAAFSTRLLDDALRPFAQPSGHDAPVASHRLKHHRQRRCRGDAYSAKPQRSCQAEARARDQRRRASLQVTHIRERNNFFQSCACIARRAPMRARTSTRAVMQSAEAFSDARLRASLPRRAPTRAVRARTSDDRRVASPSRARGVRPALR
jgi:hypothetical protein